MKYQFLVHYTTWKSGQGDLHYSSSLMSKGKYPSPEDIKRWVIEIKKEHDDDGTKYRVDILSFSKMAKKKPERT
jgi:hypothetical protein